MAKFNKIPVVELSLGDDFSIADCRDVNYLSFAAKQKYKKFKKYLMSNQNIDAIKNKSADISLDLGELYICLEVAVSADFLHRKINKKIEKNQNTNLDLINVYCYFMIVAHGKTYINYYFYHEIIPDNDSTLSVRGEIITLIQFYMKNNINRVNYNRYIDHFQCSLEQRDENVTTMEVLYYCQFDEKCPKYVGDIYQKYNVVVTSDDLLIIWKSADFVKTNKLPYFIQKIMRRLSADTFEKCCVYLFNNNDYISLVITLNYTKNNNKYLYKSENQNFHGIIPLYNEIKYYNIVDGQTILR
jgi:hypothetical protein